MPQALHDRRLRALDAASRFEGGLPAWRFLLPPQTLGYRLNILRQRFCSPDDVFEAIMSLLARASRALRLDPATHAATGAVLGAGIGAIFGNRRTAGQGAAAYGLLGAAEGGAEGATSQREIIKRYMAGRGYRVLY